uniref:Galectin domain-containing protein n=1 Tax=Oryzias latipes TaxID=8090 RepID=H2MH77_ORYLA
PGKGFVYLVQSNVKPRFVSACCSYSFACFSFKDLALHFDSCFHGDADGAVLIYNSKTGGFWGDEKREIDINVPLCTDLIFSAEPNFKFMAKLKKNSCTFLESKAQNESQDFRMFRIF